MAGAVAQARPAQEAATILNRTPLINLRIAMVPARDTHARDPLPRLRFAV
jgi:hypothetical protein